MKQVPYDLTNPSIGLEHVITFLNDWVHIDHEAVWALINARVPCSEATADHKSIQVYDHGERFTVGLLGVLNGLFGGPHAKIRICWDSDIGPSSLRFERCD